MKPSLILRHAAKAAALASALALSPVLTHAAAPAADATAPAASSLYQLKTQLTDAAGQHFTLRDMGGGPVLVTMFYGNCHSACPIVIETLKRTVGALGADGRQLRVLLISLDPQRDNPQSLAMLAQMQQLDSAQYRLAVAHDDSDTRMLASALNIRYRALDNGEISHTTRIALLTPGGAVQADSTRLDVEPDPAFVRQIAAALKR